MLVLGLILQALVFGLLEGMPQPECCETKTVGPKDYKLVKEMDTSSYGCPKNCVYVEVADPKGPMFCFKPGNLPVTCGNTTSPPGGVPAPTPAPEPSSTCETYPDGHTMIKYPGPSEECTANTIFRGVDNAGIEAIITRHNELRQKVASGSETNGNQPAASNMQKVVWNEEIATIAQRWADQCTFGHDKDRKKCDGTYVGQNAYSGWNSQESTKADVMGGLSGAVQSWYDEVIKPGFSNTDIDPFKFSYGAGHYTQVVWAETAEVGCGVVYYKDGTWYKTLVVCNYAIGGNWNGGSMYKIGTPCANCPSGTTCDTKYNALCS